MQNHLFEFNLHHGFKNPRDQSQILHLACQMFPSKPKFLQAAYEEETKDPYRYLFLIFIAIHHTNFTIPSQPLCIKGPAYLTKYSLELGLDDVKSDINYHGQSKI